MTEAPVRIENRTQLISVLREAAELEHGINCCYLFAAFTIKTSPDDGIDPRYVDALKRWQGDILGIAIDEMLHMVLVNNLLTALGSAPHLARPNLPTSPTMYPPSFPLALRPFNEQTLNGFVYLERPEGGTIGEAEAPAGASRWPQRLRSRGVFSDRPQYDTVGHLYRGIEDGFRYLSDKLGEAGLFIGEPERQASHYPNLDGLVAVTGLSSAVAAIHQIVTQGEGAVDDAEQAHYSRFRRIQEEYRSFARDDPEFLPGRLVLESPYVDVPPDVFGPFQVGRVDHRMSVAMCNLFDGAYELLVQMLGRYLLHAEETAEEMKVLAGIASGLMVRVIGPLGIAITKMPAGRSHPGLNAGPSFTFSRNMGAPPQKRAAWEGWRERLMELSGYCSVLGMQGVRETEVGRVGQAMRQFAGKMGEGVAAM